jgi:hypothetical protein
MLTFFATAKPFRGHSGTIQRNALKSWTLLQPDVEVILFGDDEGAAEVCAELCLRHEPQVKRHESGMKYLDYMFDRAQKIARHKYLCYCNCDIILLEDFWRAFAMTTARWRQFLMVSRRWDTDITEPIEFGEPSWAATVRKMALTANVQQGNHFVDFFVFNRWLYDEVPPLVVGRGYWDHWLVWKALSRGVAVLDASRYIVPVHQNHGYGYHPMGCQGTNEDELARRNIQLAGNGKHLRTMVHSTHSMTRRGEIWITPLRGVFSKDAILALPMRILEKTFPLRDRLGLRRTHLKNLWAKLTPWNS